MADLWKPRADDRRIDVLHYVHGWCSAGDVGSVGQPLLTEQLTADLELLPRVDVGLG